MHLQAYQKYIYIYIVKAWTNEYLYFMNVTISRIKGQYSLLKSYLKVFTKDLQGVQFFLFQFFENTTREINAQESSKGLVYVINILFIFFKCCKKSINVCIQSCLFIVELCNRDFWC